MSDIGETTETTAEQDDQLQYAGHQMELDISSGDDPYNDQDIFDITPV